MNAATGHIAPTLPAPAGGRLRSDGKQGVSVLPAPPDDDEKYCYIERDLPFLTAVILVGALCLVFSQLRFEFGTPALWPFLIFTFTYVVYQAISLPVNFTGSGFDLARHRALVSVWCPASYPAVDIYLPICGEPIEVLRNTWRAVSELAAHYDGTVRVYVLDDGQSDQAAALSNSLGFGYLRRPEPGAWKKSGNLRYAFARTSGEFLVILDADFAPRPDFLPGREQSPLGSLTAASLEQRPADPSW